MQNEIKRNYAGLVTQATQAVAGLDLYAAPIGVALVTRTAMNDKLVAYITGGNTSTQKKTELRTSRAELRSSAKVAFGYLSAARDMLKPLLGRQYSPAWNEVGFVNSLEVPRSEAKMIQYLQGMVAYFTAHPEMENVPSNISAARTTAVLNALTGARNTMNNKRTTLQAAVTAREADAKELRKMVSMLLNELAMKLSPLDERWLSFGFNKPGAQSVPAIPVGLVATLVGPTALALKWDAAPRAARYRIYRKIVGVDTEMVAVETRDDLDFVMENLPTGATIQVAVSAVNDAGESQLSQVSTVVTG